MTAWLPVPPDGVAAWWYWVALAAAVTLTGVSKTGFGGGIAILAVPLIATTLDDAERTLGFMLPMLIFADLFAVHHHRGNQSWPHVRWVLGGAVAGIAACTGLLLWLRESLGTLNPVLMLTVGAVCLLFVLIQCWRLFGGPLPHVPAAPWAGQVAGFFAGSVSTLAHSAGPVVSVYLLEQRLDKRRFAGTMVVVFFFINLSKVPGYLYLGLINPRTLVETLWFLPWVPLGNLIGGWMHRRVPEKPFTVIIYLATAAAATHLIVKSLS